jgi:site-specific DNA-methyltransferase (adenine-specific)
VLTKILELDTFKFEGETESEHIPCIEKQDCSPEQLFEMELAENLEREDLTWQEKAKALDKLHSFRQKHAPPEQAQTLLDTAEEARVSPSTVSAAVLVAKHLDKPEVAGAKDVKEAIKIIRKAAESEHRTKLLQKFNLDDTPHTLIHGNSLIIMPTLPAEQFDCWIGDPPYGIKADKFGDQSGTGHEYDDSPEKFKADLRIYAEEAYRLVKKDGFLFMFCDYRWFDLIQTELSLAGWKAWHKPFIWDKLGTGMLPVPDFGPRNTYECIAYAWKGTRKVIKVGAPDVLSYQPPKRLLHAAQKPVELIVELLSRVLLPGERVFDPFGGSGTTLVAANRLRLKAHVIELDLDQFNIALSRINEKELNGVTEVDVDENDDIEL